MMQNHAASGKVGFAILRTRHESILFAGRVGREWTHGIKFGFYGHIPCRRFASVLEGNVKIQMHSNFIEDKRTFSLNMIHYNPRSFAGNKHFPSELVGFDSGVDSGFGYGEVMGASSLGLLYEIASGAPKKPSCDSENNGKNCNNAISVGVDNVAKAKAITDERAIEVGYVFLKGLLGIVVVSLLQALFKRWRRPTNP